MYRWDKKYRAIWQAEQLSPLTELAQWRTKTERTCLLEPPIPLPFLPPLPLLSPEEVRAGTEAWWVYDSRGIKAVGLSEGAAERYKDLVAGKAMLGIMLDMIQHSYRLVDSGIWEGALTYFQAGNAWILAKLGHGAPPNFSTWVYGALRWLWDVHKSGKVLMPLCLESNGFFGCVNFQEALAYLARMTNSAEYADVRKLAELVKER